MERVRRTHVSARLSAVAPLAVVLIAVVTVVGVVFGPTPHAATSDSDISAFGYIMVEPADRIILATWIVVAGILTAWVLTGGADRVPRWMTGWAARVVAVAASVVAIASILVDVDRVHLRAPVDAADVVIGVVLTAAIVTSWSVRRKPRLLLTIVLVAIVLLLAVPELWQTTGSIRDWDSFRYVADEIAAPSAGRVPYGNFAPQYSALLGIPIVPIVSFFPTQVLAIVLAWLIVLQVLSLALAVGIPLLAGGPRYALSAVLIVLPPVVAMSQSGLSVTSYYAGIPLRIVLPLVTILIAYVVLRRPSATRTATALFGVGLACGVTVVNNPDFGLPCAVAVMVALLLATPGRDRRWRAAGLVVAGGVLAGAAYALAAWAAGAPVSSSFLLVFQRIFGATGYFNIPMPSAGLHVAVASLFVSASVIGVVLAARNPPATWLGRQGLVLVLVGGWSLLSLGYYAGRSYTATLIGGYALQIGLVTACLVPLTAAGLRVVIRRRPHGVPLLGSSVLLALIAVAWCTGNLARVPPPPAYLGLSSESAEDGLGALEEQVEVLTVMNATTMGATQLLEMPSVSAVASGLPTQAVVNNAAYVALSRQIATLQCEQWHRAATHLVVVTRETAKGLARSARCDAILDLGAAQPIAGTAGWVSFAVRHEVDGTGAG